MADQVVLHQLPPSPNSAKVRVALQYKGIPWRSAPVDPAAPDGRARLVELSGQPLTPVLQHGERVVYDSRAILRYLEANFPDTPRILSTDVETMRTIERLESWARSDLAEPVGMVFAEAFSESPDLEACREASRRITERCADLEERVADRPFLFGDAPNLVDITAAPYVALSLLPLEVVEALGHPAVRFFHENFRLGGGRENTRRWVGRVMEYDRLEGAPAA